MCVCVCVCDLSLCVCACVCVCKLQLSILLFSSFRLTKEVRMYEKEAADLCEKVEKMKAQGDDEYNIRKQV